MTLFTEGRLQAFERMMQDTGKYHRREDSEDRPRKCPKKKAEPAKKDITNLIYAGVDPKTVQYLAGHENSKITMDIYAKVKYNSPDALSTIVNNAFNNMYAKAE